MGPLRVQLYSWYWGGTSGILAQFRYKGRQAVNRDAFTFYVLQAKSRQRDLILHFKNMESKQFSILEYAFK